MSFQVQRQGPVQRHGCRMSAGRITRSLTTSTVPNTGNSSSVNVSLKEHHQPLKRRWHRGTSRCSRPQRIRFSSLEMIRSGFAESESSFTSSVGGNGKK
ncbi:hypothetical protein F7725_013754 [Dissostichus mawsoni]|uniref:Uncharacterized protein n=1 Tax=Dissostichus mawsoni TaxID=36200 RepID=A0A7J5YUC4_DISMA|nr:hypothetical protein F7725_013754 [Dissostichus mawsoni]